MRFCIILFLFKLIFCTEDYYSFLGVSKDATEREIRKAFKQKALLLHPDKNQDDSEAHEKFLRLNRIYEVLKDGELRKRYDLHGEEGLDVGPQRNNYHSWSYYRDNFGIYDDDMEIITLNKADFEQSVVGSDIWFINFYHPMCSHCHTLAPVWRRLARELYGVVRIGAVNCDDSYHLCSSQGIRSYPTLIAYPGRVVFKGPLEKSELFNFIFQKLDQSASYVLTESNWKSEVNKCKTYPWLLISNSYGASDQDFIILRTKLKTIFDGMICLSEVDCNSPMKLCQKLKVKDQGVYFYHNFEDLLNGEKKHKIESEDTQEMTKEILQFLPDIGTLSQKEFQEYTEALSKRINTDPFLVLFANENDEESLEIRKLPALLPTFYIGKILCSEMRSLCDNLFIMKTPTFLLFKTGGSYELYDGRILAHDIAVFAREASVALNYQVLTPNDFPAVLESGKGSWMIDFYAPWCPPCKLLLPEFKKASRIIDVPVKFGSVDCTRYGALCHQFNIHQYPTIIFYNQTKPYQYFGRSVASQIVDFVKDTLHPSVIELNGDSFEKRVGKKPKRDIWVVDFFANWCGPCNEMAPEYKKFARMVSNMRNIYIASIDCAKYRFICQKEGITGYPTIKLYPSDYSGNRYSVQYSEGSRDALSFRRWLYTYLPSEVEVLDDTSFEEVLRSQDPWLVDFFAPWCGPCHSFAVEFEDIARELKGKVKCGKVDCDAYEWICRGANIKAYPTVRFYSGTKKGRQKQAGSQISSLDKDNIIYEVTEKISQKSNSFHDEL